MRAALYLPGVVSVVVLGMVWARIYDPPFGLINQALERLGIEGPVWLGGTTWALLAISRSLGFQPGQSKASSCNSEWVAQAPLILPIMNNPCAGSAWKTNLPFGSSRRRVKFRTLRGHS